MSTEQAVDQATILGLLQLGCEELFQAGIEEARWECDRILMKLLQCSKFELYLRARAKEILEVKIKKDFFEVLEKRKKRIPLAYLLREADFWKETLYVDERCLIPRPETEILVEEALKALGGKSRERFSFLDIGTGSGAIAVALLRICENAKATLLDISKDALEVASENLKRYELEKRGRLIRGDLFKPFSKDDTWDLIVSNPPYLSPRDMANLQPELCFEPKNALDGGRDGLDFYRRIIFGSREHLTAGGTLAVEVGQSHAEVVSKWFQEAGYDNIQIFKDYLQIPRVVLGRKGS